MDYSAAESTNGVRVDLINGKAKDINGTSIGTDILYNIEKVYGSQYADNITGSDGADHMEGMDGADTLTGGYGSDTLIGGAGADTFNYNNLSDSMALNKDVIYGFESGTDKLDFTSLNLSTSDITKIVIVNNTAANKATVEYQENISSPEENFKIELLGITDLKLSDIDF